MAYRDTEVVPVPHVPGAALPAAPDWPGLYERALERAAAAEARAEELRWAEVAARAEAGTYRGLFQAARRKRLAAVEDAAEVRRAAKNALALEAEVRRLHKLLADAGVESGRGEVRGAHVLRDRHPEPEPRRRPALARRVVGGVRAQRRPAAGRPRALAAVVDGTGAPPRTDGAGMTGAVECRYHGRDFTVAEMALLRKLIAGPPALNRHALSKEFCRRVGWYKADGGLKDMMARVVMLAMHKDGRIELPPPKWAQNRPGPIVFGPDTEPPLLPPPTALDEVRPVELRMAVRYSREGKLWNEYVARYHYLGYKTLVGAQMRYTAHAGDGTPLAMLGFSTAAWRLAPRDRFIGWTPELREKNLPLVVDNPRFLILPWIKIPNLGSHILAVVRRQLPVDWTARYNTTPVLIETFVETPRYTGAVYRASGWIPVGTTQGRGRYDRKKLFDKPKKDIWLRPLRKDWKRLLNR